MKKKLFLALLTALVLLLAVTTALAVSPSDYNCPLCGEPCTEWYGYFSQDGTASLHSPACYICYTFVWDVEFLCTPAEGTATCLYPAVCSVCGSLDPLGSAPDPNAHVDMSRWIYASPTQHYRYCLDCFAENSYEYEDHYGGTATCSTQALCADCESYYGDIDPDAHEWGDWFPDETGTHFRTCGLNGEHIEFGSCTGDSWVWLNDEYHVTECADCGGRQLAEHTGGTATCTTPRICEVCNEPYGKPDNSGLTGHPNPVIEEKPGTCYDEGYYRITCDEPGCAMPFFEITTPANGQHIYNDWQPVGDGSHIAACHYCGEELTVPCTVFTAELFAACPICGEYEGGVLAVVYAHDDDESLPYGTLVIRGGEIPVDGALCAITVAGSYGGQVVELTAPVTVSLPMELTGFRIIDMNGEEIPFTLENGVLTFETAKAGLFLLVPAE